MAGRPDTPNNLLRLTQVRLLRRLLLQAAPQARALRLDSWPLGRPQTGFIRPFALPSMVTLELMISKEPQLPRWPRRFGMAGLLN